MKTFYDFSFSNLHTKNKNYFYNHIKGLGISDFSSTRHIAQGFVAQEEIRRALAIIIEMINEQNHENQGIMITGINGIGKTSLSFGISFSIREQIPFIKIDGSEINSPFISRLEILNQVIRKAIGIFFYQESIIIKGEVVCIQAFSSSKCKEEVSPAKLILKTETIQSVYEIGPNIFKRIMEKKIIKGDVITINKINGDIHSFKKAAMENILENFPTSVKNNTSGSLEKHNIIEYFLTLYDLDFLNSSNKGISNIFSDFEFQIPITIRNKIDKIVLAWEKNLKAKIIKGILFIDDVNLLDQDCFAFLSKVMETYIAPFFFFYIRMFKS